METTVYNIDSNGKNYVFNVIHNFTEPCPQCGVPACGKEDIIWYELNGKSYALVYDGGIFDLIGEEYFNENISKVKIDQFPKFMKQWYELSGWHDNDNYNGYILNADDYIKSLSLINISELSEWLQSYAKEYIENMIELATKAKQLNLNLKIVKG